MSSKTPAQKLRVPFFQRLRDLVSVVRCWFTGSEAVYETTFIQSGPGSLSRVLRLRPVFDAVDVRTVEGKSVKFMTDFRLLSSIPKKFWSSPSNVGTFVTNFSNTSDQESEDVEPVEFVGDYNGNISIGGVDVDNIGLVSRSALANPDVKPKPFVPKPAPKDVFGELVSVPTPVTLEGLDEKIETLERTIDLVRVSRAGGNSNTAKDVIERLRNRCIYRDDEKVRAFFDTFKNTTDDMIVALLTKYDHLRIGPVDDFLVEMPSDAQNTMLGYADKTVELFKTKPVFYIIANAEDFARTENDRTRRDPILLVQSPFGFFWQILGAWDAEEMMALHEL